MAATFSNEPLASSDMALNKVNNCRPGRGSASGANKLLAKEGMAKLPNVKTPEFLRKFLRLCMIVIKAW